MCDWLLDACFDYGVVGLWNVGLYPLNISNLLFFIYTFSTLPHKTKTYLLDGQTYPIHDIKQIHETNNKKIDNNIYMNIHSKKKRTEAEVAFQEGKENLEILKRQVVLGSLYPSARSVMENVAAWRYWWIEVRLQLNIIVVYIVAAIELFE